MFLHADSEDSGQTGRMPRLIWVFVGRTCHFVRFVTRRLICNPIILRYWLLTTEVKYRKCPKYSDTQNICCNHSKIWTVRLYHRVMSPNDADGISNSVDPDQTSLIWVCTVCPGISFRKLRIITACFLWFDQQTFTWNFTETGYLFLPSNFRRNRVNTQDSPLTFRIYV